MVTSKEQVALNGEFKEMIQGEIIESSSTSMPNLPVQNVRPTSMVIKKTHSLIPAHLVAEAMSTLRGLVDLRWSGPITPSEMQYVKQYVLAKYPQYYNGILEEPVQIDPNHLSLSSDSPEPTTDDKPTTNNSPKVLSSSPSFIRTLSDLDKCQLEASRLSDIVTKKNSVEGNFVSIPEIQARNRALRFCGLSEEDYLVIFVSNYKDAMVMVGESYPFFKGNYYMTILNQEVDGIREFAANKDSKVIPMPETWLDLRIKGSQLSQYFRKKCKYIPKGLFAYPIMVNGIRFSLHWISEAHRNSWHVLIDAAGLGTGEERLALAIHRPDFVLCNVENHHSLPSNITCLLVRKMSFDNYV